MRVLFTVLVVLLIGIAFLLAPGYLELDVAVVPHKGGGPFWRESQRAELAYQDSAGVLYVNRTVGTAYVDAQHWKTVADVIAFFDDQMRQRGWTLTSTGGSDPAVPETRLLPAENIRGYFRSQDAGPESSYVIVVAWPVGGRVEGFNVVLTTVNPSLLKRLWKGLD